ncbi:MAG TPA: protein kinase [Kofleriaceae bacterium]|nr:protein kinase [Kofleriaceae bacterium]
MADVAAEEQFGPYVIYERLGVGGMATVHRALERGVEGFERSVALKRLLPHLAEDASFIKSFVREAKLASLLAHINIVQIYELGRVGTEYFISMEYIDGRDVRQILRHCRKVTGPAPIHVTVGLVLQLCEALDYAHTRVDETGSPLGLVHRDVSPSNLLVTSHGHLKVIDFGIAKAQSAQLRTQTGRVKGKLAYMAPEAISGSRDLDARSDVWAVGVILHELLTARPLFASKNEYQTLLKVQRVDIMAPSTFNQACPAELDAIVFKALARDADHRFASAAELRRELERVRTQYHLHTGYRDISQWLDWAFALESPASFSGASHTLEPSQISISMRTPTPQPGRDDEDAVEIAWGGGEVGAPSGPIVLDDVPDVSAKHRVPATVVADDNDADDIPTPQPSHGRRNSTRARTVTVDPIARESPRPGSDAYAKNAVDSVFGDTIDDRQGNRPPSDVPIDVDLDVGDAEPSPFAEPPLGPLARTKPGIAPANAHRFSGPIEKRAQSMRTTTIGAALVERNQTKSRGWLLAIALLFLAGGGGSLAWYATTRGAPAAAEVKPAPAASHEPGTLKFETEPGDAIIAISGDDAISHTGSPWQATLPPGTHQIEIRHAGYKAWLTSLDLSARETQTLRVVLEPLGAKAATGDATLALSTTPSDLEVVLDGALLGAHTPIRIALKIGTHSIAVRQAGAIVWKQTLTAAAASNYEFSPVFTPQGAATEGGAAPASDRPSMTIEAPPITPALAQAAVQMPAVPNVPAVPAVEPAPSTASITVAPNAVTKLSGAVPDGLHAAKGTPSVAAAKLCIDPNGAVTNVDFISKLDHHLVGDLTAALQAWKYQPYKKNGAAISVCFAVTLRLKS